MKTLLMITTVAFVSLSAGVANAGGWGQSGSQNHSNGLVNVSPSLGVGDVGVLNGTAILNGSPVASGNVVQGILNGNRADVGNGILGGSLKNILGGNRHGDRGRRGHRGRW